MRGGMIGVAAVLYTSRRAIAGFGSEPARRGDVPDFASFSTPLFCDVHVRFLFCTNGPTTWALMRGG